jgi:hypothetical protein
MSIVPLRAFTSPEGRSLAVVVLRCPYDTINEERTRKLFSDLFALKVSGYRDEYPYGVLPMETADYVGTHLLICERHEDDLIPLAGFKSITWSRCQTHHLEFPIFHMTQGQDPAYERVIRELLSDAGTRSEEVGYNGSWTIRPDLRSNREFTHLLRDLSYMMLVRYYTEYNIPHIIAAASTRFKVDEVKKFLGFDYLRVNDVALPPIEVTSYFGEKATIMHLRRFTREALALAERFIPLWESKLVIEGTAASQALRKIAA